MSFERRHHEPWAFERRRSTRYRRMLVVLKLGCGVPASSLEEEIKLVAVQLPFDKTISWLLARSELVKGNDRVGLDILRMASLDNTVLLQSKVQDAYKRHDLATAVKFLGLMDALADDSSHQNSALAYDLACSVYRDAGMPRESIRYCLKFTTVAPHFGAAWLQLGSAYLAARDYVEAVKAVERAVALQPGDAWSRELLAMCYQAAGEPEKANAAFETALRLDPTRDDARGWHWLRT